MTETQQTIGEWADETFGRGTIYDRAVRLKQELEELMQSVCIEEVSRELADCYIVMMTIAHTAGIDLQSAVDKKMAINRQRKWTRTGGGCGQHVAE